MNTEKLIRSALKNSIKDMDLNVLTSRVQELVLRSSESEEIATQLVCGVPVEIDTGNIQETYRDLLGYILSISRIAFAKSSLVLNSSLKRYMCVISPGL